jgi:hypothetical protein
VVSGFERIQKGVQKLLKMNLQKLFHKRKRKSFISLPIFLGFWPAGPTSPPFPPCFHRPKWALPLFSFGPAEVGRSPPLLGPAHSYACVPTRLAR